MSWHAQKDAALRGEYSYDFNTGNVNDVMDLKDVLSGLPAARHDGIADQAVHPKQVAANAPRTRTVDDPAYGYHFPGHRQVAMELAPLHPNFAEEQQGRLREILAGAQRMQSLKSQQLPGSNVPTAFAPRSKDSGRTPGSLYQAYDQPPTHTRETLAAEGAADGGSWMGNWKLWLFAAAGLTLYIMWKSNGQAPQQVKEHIGRIRDHFRSPNTAHDVQQYQHGAPFVHEHGHVHASPVVHNASAAPPVHTVPRVSPGSSLAFSHEHVQGATRGHVGFSHEVAAHAGGALEGAMGGVGSAL